MDSIGLKNEWLETNGLGGYSSSTLVGCHTRKYHGLLVTRLSSPPGKFVLLSKVEDSLSLEEREYYLTAHRYPNVLFPKEGLTAQSYRNQLCPTVEYEVEASRVTKELMMVQGHNTVLMRYTVSGDAADAVLRIKPLLAYRDFHELTRENLSLRVRTFPAYQGFVMSPYAGMPSFFMQCDGNFQFYPAPVWYQNFEYAEERNRGFDSEEDLFCPGVFEIAITKDRPVLISASTEEQKDISYQWDKETARRQEAEAARTGSPLQRALKRAAKQFVVVRPDRRRSVTAGYHWFLEWGRDAMISLPGLLLTEGRTEAYLDVLSAFAKEQKRGIIPNFLGEVPGQNAYNTADAGLWFAWAVQQYIAETKDESVLSREIGAALLKIYTAYRNGTDHGIKMQEDGLLKVGSPYEQVTWMDAVDGDRPVTPRWGCPVEINALWYNFHRFLGQFGDALVPGLAAEAEASADKIKASFVRSFWLEDKGRLADVVRKDFCDESIRPNQIFAVSLPYSPLDADRAASVVKTVRDVLLTPYGLRTLAPGSPEYRPVYEGTPNERTRVYHNGTVWPWLLGAYGEALLKTTKNSAEAVDALTACLSALETHLGDAGLDTISEIFDGDAPHEARGAVAQAWSVAEILRLTSLLEKAKGA